MDQVAKVVVPPHVGLLEDIMKVLIDGLGDDVGIDGKDCDVGGVRGGEQRLDGVQDVQDLFLLAAVQPVDDDDHPRLDALEGIHALGHVGEGRHLLLEASQESIRFQMPRLPRLPFHPHPRRVYHLVDKLDKVPEVGQSG